MIKPNSAEECNNTDCDLCHYGHNNGPVVRCPIFSVNKNQSASKKPMVYIASPFSKGDQLLNLRAHIDIYNRLLNYGRVIPVAPLTATYAHMIEPRSYEEWLALDFELIGRCDALFANDAIIFSDRMVNGIPIHMETESPGRDKEAAHALEIGIPVFSDFDKLRAWVEK